jgi:molybdopterin-guanine dinucleotide biosynthesis protein A
MSSDDVTLALLAGGAGSRMGMRKDLVRVRGTGLVEWMLRRAAWRGPTMLVGPADGASLEGEGLVDVVVRDETSGEGPLRGVVSALVKCQTSAMVVVPIDMPGIGARHLAWMVERAREMPEVACVMLRRQVDGAERIEPFPSFYRKGFQTVGLVRLRGEKRAMQGLIQEKGVGVVDAPLEWEERVWTNLNREADVARFEAEIASMAKENG